MSIDLRERLSEETATLVPVRDLATAAKRSGRRTLAVRRGRRGFGTLLVALAVAVLVVPTSWNPIPRTVLGHTTDPLGRFSWSDTKGDLGDDRAFVEKALETWNSGMHTAPDAHRGIFDDLTGPARVIWAGTTPGGPAAVVAQPANLHSHDNLSSDDTGRQTLLGFLGPNATGQLSVISDSYAARGSTAGAQVGGAVSVDSRTWVLLDIGEPLALGARDYGPHGTTMQWTPVTFDDGVTVVQLPADVNPLVAYIARQPFTGWDDIRFVAPAVGGAMNADPWAQDNRLLWGPTAGDAQAFTYLPIHGTSAWPTRVRDASVQQAFDFYERTLDGALDKAANYTALSLWTAGGILPNGQRVIVGERQLDDDPSNLWVVVADPDNTAPQVINGGPVDPAANIPVKVHLPNGAGWLVVAKGADLSYRSDKGQWTSAGRDAALLPESASEVRAVGESGSHISDLASP